MVKLENYQTTDGVLMDRREAIDGLKFLRSDGHMGDVYEVKRVDLENGSFVTERLVTTSSYLERVVWKSKWQEKVRWDCFCCTCGDGPADAYCRNHGFAGSRPCDIHNTPGTPDEGGVMPDSVLTFRAHRGLE